MRFPISIIIPVHNEASNLTKVLIELEKVTNEWDIKPEIIIVDDGSNDETPFILETLSQNNSQIQAIRLDNRQGKTSAWQHGFRAAKHEIIVTMDGICKMILRI